MPLTELKDKTGASIYSGDILQWRLGKFAKKSSGPTMYQVYISKKKGVSIRSLGAKTGWQLRPSDCKYVVIVDKTHREL